MCASPTVVFLHHLSVKIDDLRRYNQANVHYYYYNQRECKSVGSIYRGLRSLVDLLQARWPPEGLDEVNIAEGQGHKWNSNADYEVNNVVN